MSEQTATTQRFTLDETRAGEWIERAVSVYDGTAEDDNDADELPQISNTWEPVAPGEENEVWRLVRRAVDTAVIGRPDDSYDLDFEYVADDDGGYYYFLVRVGGPCGLKLASHAYEMRKLDGHEEAGATAALAVLREAVRSANGVLQDLDEYVKSHR
jgi:hypothetical protein